MAEERIDIVVTDKVDSNVAKNLNNIADAADRGQTHLERLKSALSAVNSSGLDRLAAAMAKVDAAQAKVINAQARLTSAQNQGSIAAQKVALAQQKIATEAARTEAAQQRAAAATSAAEAAQIRLAAAQGRAAATAASAAAAQGQLATATAQAGTAAANGGNSFRAYVAGIQASNAAANGAAGANQRLATGMNSSAQAAGQYSRAQRQVTAANANIIAQIQDIGVSLAGGQNPLLVMIQQGSQLSYIASTMEGGMKALIATIGRMLLAWAPVIAVLGAVWAALDEVSDKLTEDAGLKEYIKTLGLTDKEVKKLKDTHVTIGDVIKATWQVLSENVLATMGFTTEEIKTFWNDTADKILKFMKYAFIGIGALTVALIRTIAAVVVNIGKIFYNAGIAAKNLFMIGIQALANLVIDAFNGIGGAVNAFTEAAGLGKVVPVLQRIDLGVRGVTDGFMELSEVNPLQYFNEAARNAEANLGKIGDRAQELARRRLRGQANEIISDRNPRAAGRGRKPAEDKTEENRAKALAAVNLQLDNELARMKMLKGEREIQQRMDQITQQLAQKGITLNETETRAIEAKVRAVESFKKVQSEMDRIYDEVNGPAEKYQNTLAAIAELQGQGAITAAQAAQQQNKANRAYQEATDPLFQFEENLAAAQRTSGLYGDALERANYLESIRQALVAQGYEGDRLANELASARVQNLLAENAALQQKNYLTQQAGSVASGIVDPLRQDQTMLENKQAYYDELNRMADEYNLSEANRKKALAALDRQYLELQMSDYSSFFNTLSGLASSGYGELAAIGKAAAITQATINMYVAASEALKLPFPANLPAIAQVIAQGASLIGQIRGTNAGSFANGGQFMVEGKSGVDANNINMNVTRGERVTVETPAQQRATDAALAGGGAAPQTNLKVVNVIDPREALASIDTAEGEQVIINIIERNAPTIQKLMGSR